MPIDQPENPRIRTKLNRLDSRVDDGFYDILEELRLVKINVEEFQRRCLEFFGPLIKSGHFDDVIHEAEQADDQVWLVRRHTDHCRYTVLFYRVDEGEVHPPHHHHNVISTQIIVSGKIRIREYNRKERDDQGRLHLELVSDRLLLPGDKFQASEWSRNVHWFQAVDGPAIIFNTNARGYETSTFDPDEGTFGRRYIDPTIYIDNAGNRIVGKEFDEFEAEKRFQGKALDEFPVAAEILEQVERV